MKILMGIDDSKFSGDVLQAVITQFRPEHIEIRVLHVLQPSAPAPPQMAPGYAPELDDQKKPAHEVVERIASELRRGGFKVDTVEVGDIRERIIDAAEEWGADLIVVGSHGRSGIQRFLLGSVAEFVARHAKCSVEIVRTPAQIRGFS
jgi:nucleotide-binding universal stress UspA family protein